MANRIDSFADAMTGWLAEYAQKQQVSCGTVEGHDRGCSTAPSGNQAPPAGIHLVPEPPAILLVIDELTFRSYAHNRRISPEISPERWAAIFGKEQVEAMEKRFQEQVEPPAIPEEPEWSDSDTARQMYDNITGRS